jgi:hypothetical protein
MANMIDKQASIEASGLFNAINGAGVALNSVYDTLVQNIETASDGNKLAIYGIDTTDQGGFSGWTLVRDRVKFAFDDAMNFTTNDLGHELALNQLLYETLHLISPVTSQAKTFRSQIIAFRNSCWQLAGYADTLLWLNQQSQDSYITNSFGIQLADIPTVRDRLTGAAKYIRGETLTAGERPFLAAALWQTILRP